MKQHQLTAINELSKKIEYLKKHIAEIEKRKINCQPNDLIIRVHITNSVNDLDLLDDCFHKDEFLEMYLWKANQLLMKFVAEFEAL